MLQLSDSRIFVLFVLFCSVWIGGERRARMIIDATHAVSVSSTAIRTVQHNERTLHY
jgi:hypothetical protein